MTLLIGTRAENNIVLTADGLSRRGAVIESENLQKIFPHSTLPVAIAHHGLNIINQKPASQWVVDFYQSRAEDLEASTLKQIADKLVVFIDNDARKTINSWKTKHGIGFWITGFGWRQTLPDIFEIFWPNNVTPKNDFKERLILGGDAKKFLEKYPDLNQHPILRNFSMKEIEKYFPAVAVDYHNALYKTAEKLQKASGKLPLFGGHKHQLIIESSGCTWKKSPT